MMYALYLCWPNTVPQVSEDCLYINVIRPAGCSENDKLPVAFWIHGGGFVQGGGVDQRYNLSFTVENSVKIGKVRYNHTQKQVAY
jgi:carboxylesterase type B